MVIHPHEVHIVTFPLTLQEDEAATCYALLDEEEKKRADRFQFITHRLRFIKAHATLRAVLGLYLDEDAKAIQFAYNAHQKPFVHFPPTSLTFNLAHSHTLAVIALTLEHDIGVDLEKIDTEAKEHKIQLAKRFFTDQEYQQLLTANKNAAFYQLWAYKEALIKAVGKGLSLSLASFAIDLEKETQTLNYNQQTWTLTALPLDPDYPAALATNQAIKNIYYWKFEDHGIIPCHYHGG
jgi:4'-phosphopantetheinyl transferase